MDTKEENIINSNNIFSKLKKNIKPHYVNDNNYNTDLKNDIIALDKKIDIINEKIDKLITLIEYKNI